MRRPEAPQSAAFSLLRKSTIPRHVVPQACMLKPVFCKPVFEARVSKPVSRRLYPEACIFQACIPKTCILKGKLYFEGRVKEEHLHGHWFSGTCGLQGSVPQGYKNETAASDYVSDISMPAIADLREQN